ncbi:hypothetical protein GCM10009115_12190 [Sphingopyxis soli]|jgi:hypothetical protein|uniref:Uncharacterized protein n=1 Tax=Sphingopyxis soli TaxID=592051 RepID=A0ABP3XBK9_9SPHN|nr:hypothetical protein [Sphingopyxis soli]
MTFANSEFVALVKRTRATFGVGIDEAHALVFADAEMRRLIAWRINHDPECRRQALHDLKRKGERSFFVEIDGRLRFREAGKGD